MSREVMEVVKEESAQVGKRPVAVQARRVRIEPTNGGEPFTVVDVNIVVGKYSFHMTVPEALEAVKMMSRILPEAARAHERQREWERKKRVSHQPIGREFTMGKGKTERKKKAGKAGADWHKRRKAERAGKETEKGGNR